MLNLYVKLSMMRALAGERLRRDETGATAVEYGVMVALIIVAVIVTVGLIGTRLNAAFTTVLNALPGG
jgi:pilus assembly protein Flp/PilA